MRKSKCNIEMVGFANLDCFFSKTEYKNYKKYKISQLHCPSTKARF